MLTGSGDSVNSRAEARPPAQRHAVCRDVPSLGVKGAFVRPQCEPPVTSKFAPVTHGRRSDARASTASATSSGTPVRPNGVISIIKFR